MIQSNNYPADTLRNNDVIMTSKWRYFDVIASRWRRFDVITPLLVSHVFSGYDQIETQINNSHS